VADPYLTPEQVRAKIRRQVPSDVTNDEIAELVTEFEEIAEQYRGVAFTDRTEGDEDPPWPGVVFETPPQVAKKACVEYVWLSVQAARSGTSRDVIAQTVEGNFTRYGTPSWPDGRPTGWNEVDRLLNSLPDYRVPGVA
jgi:hypothetical protein